MVGGQVHRRRPDHLEAPAVPAADDLPSGRLGPHGRPPGAGVRLASAPVPGRRRPGLPDPTFTTGVIATAGRGYARRWAVRRDHVRRDV